MCHHESHADNIALQLHHVFGSPESAKLMHCYVPLYYKSHCDLALAVRLVTHHRLSMDEDIISFVALHLPLCHPSHGFKAIPRSIAWCFSCHVPLLGQAMLSILYYSELHNSIKINAVWGLAFSLFTPIMKPTKQAQVTQQTKNKKTVDA